MLFRLSPFQFLYNLRIFSRLVTHTNISNHEFQQPNTCYRRCSRDETIRKRHCILRRADQTSRSNWSLSRYSCLRRFPIIRSRTATPLSPPLFRPNMPANPKILSLQLSPAIRSPRNQTARQLSPPPIRSNDPVNTESLSLTLSPAIQLPRN